MQEASYRAFGPGPAGPRISSILGALFASAALLGWLISRGFVRWIALGCSLLLFWDPLFVESYRGARVDSWAMAFMLLALWVVSEGRKNTVARIGVARWQVIAGLSVAVAMLTWVSAILLVPLFVLECLQEDRDGIPVNFAVRLAGLVWLGIFSAIFLVLLLLPVASTIGGMLDDSSGFASESVTRSFNFDGLIYPYARSPWVPLVAIILIFSLRLWSAGLAMVAGIVLVLLTEAYSGVRSIDYTWSLKK